MTQPRLLAFHPQGDDEVREAVIDRAVCAEGRIGGVGVSVLQEPLMKTVDGARVQSVRIIAHDIDLRAVGILPVLTGPGERDLVVAVEGGPGGSVRLLARAVRETVPVVLTLPGLGDGSIRFDLVAQREWTVHLVHHSHFDFGYTDRQPEVFAAQRAYLDSAIDLVEKTADWPEDARFRWNSEALWAIEDWRAHRTEQQFRRLVEHVESGSIGLSALPYNLHTDVCSTDELHELLRGARRLRDEFGIPFVSAMQTDVPGQVAGLPDALSGLGVRYLSVAHNWAGRSQPLAVGGIDLPRLFRWRSPGGNEVLVWMTDSLYGLAYMEGPMLGFTEGFDQVESCLPAYLTAMATRGYPYPTDVFGGPGTPRDDREPYPWDVLHLRTQGTMGDNGPARLKVSEIVRRWNETWESPRLRVSRNEDFFADAEARLGDRLTTVQGDWGDWWVEGVGSAAVPMSLLRRAQAETVDARTISQLSAWSGGEPVRGERRRADEAYDAVSMFNEHTWGAGNSWTYGDHAFDSGELQWQWKAAQALTAQQRSSALVETALAQLGEAVSAGEGAELGFVIANPTGMSRSGQARFLVPEALVPFGRGIAVTDARTGEHLPFALEAQDNPTHRESGRWVDVRVPEVPAWGYVRIDVHDVDPVAPRERRLTGAALVGVPREELLTLENEHLRVVVDEQASVIASLVEKRTGRELVDREAVVGFNGYVYDTYASTGAGFNHLANRMTVSERLEMVASRTLAHPARIVERVDDAVGQSLTYEYRAEGVDGVRVTLRLRHDDPRLLIENRLAKPSRREKESAYLAFPFAGDRSRLRFEVSGGVTGDGLPHVPGAPQHMRAVRDWVVVEDGEHAVAWVTRDAPLVQPHAIAVPYVPFPASTEPAGAGTVYSWVHNNLWDTNFPIEQGFEASFHYAVGVRRNAEESVAGLALRTAVDLVHPLRAARANRHGGDPLPERGLLRLSDPRVQLIGALQAEDGGTIVRLQSFAEEPVPLELAFDQAPERAARATLLGDEIAELVVDDGAVRLDLAPFESAAIRVTR